MMRKEGQPLLIAKECYNDYELWKSVGNSWSIKILSTVWVGGLFETGQWIKSTHVHCTTPHAWKKS